MNCNVAAVATAGRQMGRTMEKNIPDRVQPSIDADSSSSLGTVRIYADRIKKLSDMLVTTYAMITAMRVFKMPSALNSIFNGIISAYKGIVMPSEKNAVPILLSYTRTIAYAAMLTNNVVTAIATRQYRRLLAKDVVILAPFQAAS